MTVLIPRRLHGWRFAYMTNDLSLTRHADRQAATKPAAPLDSCAASRPGRTHLL